MKIPLEWLSEYVKTDKTPQEIADSFTEIGLMLEKPISSGVLELEHRMDRADWLSIVGCARDFAAFENTELIFPKLHETECKIPDKKDIVEIKVECPDLVNRFNTRVIKNIAVKPSPQWLVDRLNSYGIPAINNVVDITNYVMVELGQPMHAQDLAKFKKREITLRKAKTKETITTLLGEVIELDDSMFVLSTAGKATVIGGIVGGKDTGVDENTTEILLDAGNYNQNSVRKTSRKLKIQNETVLRFDKFLHPKLTEIAINRAVGLILELCGGEYMCNFDYYPKEIPLKQLSLTFSRLELLSGTSFAISDVKNILQRLGYQVIEEHAESLDLLVPYFRTDVEVEDDVIADVLRINGYSKIETDKIDSAPPTEITQKIYIFEEKLRDIMVSIGLHEHISDPTTTKVEAGELDTSIAPSTQVVLSNALNSQKNALRNSLYETLYPMVEIYKKHKQARASIFEIGKIYKLIGDPGDLRNYSEPRVMQVIHENFAATPKQNSLELRSILESLAGSLGIKYKIQKEGNVFEISCDGGSLGEISYNSFSLNTQRLMDNSGGNSRIRTSLGNVRTVDLSISIGRTIPSGQVIDFIEDNYKETLKVYFKEEYESPDNPGNKSILIGLEYEVEDFSPVKEKIVEGLKHRFDAR